MEPIFFISQIRLVEDGGDREKVRWFNYCEPDHVVPTLEEESRYLVVIDQVIL